MTREEFLERFALKDSGAFEGRGPHRANDRHVSGGEVLVHLFSAADPREAALAARVAELSGGAFRVYDLQGTLAVVTPNELSYVSIEGWLESLPAARIAPKEQAANSTTKHFSIRVRTRSPTPAAGDPPVTPAASDAKASPPAAPPSSPVEPAPSGEMPGAFTRAFGRSSTPEPTNPPAPSLPEAAARPEPPGSFTQQFGGSGPPPLKRATPDLLKTPDLAAPKFKVDQKPPEPVPKPAASPPPPKAEPGEFTRFFGVGAAAQAADALRKAQPPSLPVPQPDFGSLVPKLPTPASDATSDQTSGGADAAAPPPFSPEASLFSQVVQGAVVSRGANLAASATAKASTPSAPSGDAGPKRQIVPLVLALSVAAVAVLALILAVILAR